MKKLKTMKIVQAFGRLTLSSKCVVCGSKRSRIMKEQEAKGFLTNLGTKTPINKIPLLNVLF